jgi:hypothetical protein
MATLAAAGIVHWAVKDPHSTILKQNWTLRPESAIEIVTAIFYGVCRVSWLHWYGTCTRLILK